jgi:hypothetical protein
MEKPHDPFTEMTLADAARVLGYRGASTLALMFRQGKIPGARKISTKTVAVPLKWVQKQLKLAEQEGPKVGKPRGYIKNEI